MANPVYVLPEPSLALIQFLRARPELTTLLPAANIVSRLPATVTYPYVLISQNGGGSSGLWPAIDYASLEINVVTDYTFTAGTASAGQETCSLIARTVRAAIWSIRNDIVAAGTLTSSAEEIAPQWGPDTVTVPPLARYVQRHRIVLHP